MGLGGLDLCGSTVTRGYDKSVEVMGILSSLFVSETRHLFPKENLSPSHLE